MKKGRHIINLVNEQTENTYSFFSLDIPDVTLACSDGRLTVDLPTLGLLFPQLAQLLPVFLQAPLAILLPQHSMEELVARLQEVTGGAVGLERVKKEGLGEVKIETSCQSERTENRNLNKEYQDDFVAGGNTFPQVEHSLMNSLPLTEGSFSVVMEEQQIEVQKQEENMKRKRPIDKIGHKKLCTTQEDDLVKSEFMGTGLVTDSDLQPLIGSDVKANAIATAVRVLTQEQEELVIGMVKEGVTDQQAARFLIDLTGMNFTAEDIRNMMNTYIKEGETFESSVTTNIYVKPRIVQENASIIEAQSLDEKESKILQHPNFNQEEKELKLTKQEEEIMKEIKDEVDDTTSLMKKFESSNPKNPIETLIEKYNRVMLLVSEKENKPFVPLESTAREEIPELLTRFFKLVRTKKGEVYNGSTYSTFLSLFSQYLYNTFSPPIYMRDSSFDTVRHMVKMLKNQSRQVSGKAPGDQAFLPVTAGQMQQAWQSGSLGREDPDSLAAATYLVVTEGLGCRAQLEVRRITNGALVWGRLNPSTKVHETVRLDEGWLARNRSTTGGRQGALKKAQIKADNASPQTCMVRTLMAFQARKTAAQCAPEQPFFWGIFNPARLSPGTHEKWFTSKPMGVHYIAKLFTGALTRAGVDCAEKKLKGVALQYI